MEWKSKRITHEGLPLLLRYPKNLNCEALKRKFIKLVVVRHTLSKVSPNGLPDPDYNDSLFQFDNQIREAFESSHCGVTVLIETFGGKRNYYIYADSKNSATKIVTSLERTFPQEALSWSVHTDASWSFIENYSKEFLVEP